MLLYIVVLHTNKENIYEEESKYANFLIAKNL